MQDLLLIYVNDLVDDLITTPYLFADDTSLFMEIDPLDYFITFDQMNRDLQVLSDWARLWRVTFNPSKAAFLIEPNSLMGAASEAVLLPKSSKILDQIGNFS